MTPAARLAAAIDLLAEIDHDRRPADAVANAFFRDRRYIGSGDRRAVSDRAWRVLRARRRLTWWLERAETAPTPRMLAAASLLLEGWRYDGLAQSFSGGQYGAPSLIALEAAALRRLEGQTLNHPDMPPATALELPDWLYPALLQAFEDRLPAEMAALLAPAPLDLRVNSLRTTREAAQAALAAEGLQATPTPLSPWGLRIADRRPVTSGQAFQTGLVEIQDEGSQLVAALLAPEPDHRVVDWCAGAGGKTLAIAAAMANRGHITACDVSAPRLAAATQRLRRAGAFNVERHLVTPGDKWLKRHAGTAHRVLVDAPCTGTGTWRRNPDARTRLTEQTLTELTAKQADILHDAARLVRTGGRLVYATCSLLPAENEAQIDHFLQTHPDFAVLPLAAAWPWPTEPPCPGPYLRLTPLHHETDGFFAAVLEKKGQASALDPSRDSVLRTTGPAAPDPDQ